MVGLQDFVKGECQQMFTVRSLGYVGVESPHYKIWEDIGPNVFAMQLGVGGADGAVRLKIDDYDYRISVHPGQSDRLLYVGWELGAAEEIDAAAEALAAAGVPYEMGTPAE